MATEIPKEMQFKASVDLDAEKAIESMNDLVSLCDEIGSQVVIRGARYCTINVYPSRTTFIESGKNESDDDEGASG